MRYRTLASIVLFLCTFFAHSLFAQGVNDYVYVHKRLVNLSSAPWQCNCYSVSRSSLINTGNANNQVWMVDRFNDWATAEGVRDALNISSNACSICPGVDGGSASSGLFVFANCSESPCQIGVADSSYREPGWRAISDRFSSHPAAWQHACGLHRNGRYFAPAIAEGVINCRDLAQGGFVADSSDSIGEQVQLRTCPLGSWTYRTSTGFTDTHTFLESGRMNPDGSWTLRGEKLTVEWPNGWRNIYELGADCQRMTGISLGPQGQERATSMVRQD